MHEVSTTPLMMHYVVVALQVFKLCAERYHEMSTAGATGRSFVVNNCLLTLCQQLFEVYLFIYLVLLSQWQYSVHLHGIDEI